VPDTSADAYCYLQEGRRRVCLQRYGDIYTLGGNSAERRPALELLREGAWQWGWKRDSSVRTPVKPWSRPPGYPGLWLEHQAQLSVQGSDGQPGEPRREFLSGDDPSTTREDEMFDVLWGRWPRLQRASISIHTRWKPPGRSPQLNDLLPPRYELELRPGERHDNQPGLQRVVRARERADRALNPALFSGSGHLRGNFFPVLVKHSSASTWSGQVWAEVLREGKLLRTAGSAELPARRECRSVSSEAAASDQNRGLVRLQRLELIKAGASASLRVRCADRAIDGI